MPTSITRVFRHPLTICSIALLLVNDHILKLYFPSWLTGKLSDFAGLFFFPFLLALMLYPLLRSERRSIVFALFLTASIFIPLKTVPAFHADVIAALQSNLGLTLVISLDPTDLIALIALLPAWLLWRNSGGAPDASPTSPRKLELVMVAIGSIAAIATTPMCDPRPSFGNIPKVFVLEDKIYVGYFRQPDEPSLYQYSIDVRTHQPVWKPVYHRNTVVADILRLPLPELPYFVCDPYQKSLCYRIDGSQRIEESHDGGRTWQTSWQFPAEREEVIWRMRGSIYCPEPNLAIVDIAFLPDPSGSLVVAVAGIEGTLIRKGSDPWQRVTTTNESLTLIPATVLDAVYAIPLEILVEEFSALLGYTMLYIVVRFLRSKKPDHNTKLPRWVIHPSLLILAWLLAIPGILLALYNNDSLIQGPILLLSIPATAIMLVTLLILGWPDEETRSGRFVLLAISSLALLPFVFFMLWLYAIIPYYSIALTFSIVIPLVIYIRCFRRVIQMYQIQE